MDITPLPHRWDLDPDWCAVAQNAAHSQHHIGIDRHGNYFCRECSSERIHTLSDDEIQRLLLIDRVTILHVGDYVQTKFGIAQVEAITLVMEANDKGEDDGVSVPRIPWALVQDNWAIINLSNKHWCYGDQIEAILTPAEVAAQGSAV